MSKRVLVFAPFGSFKVHHQLDAVVATALRLRGCGATVVRCDGLFEVCDVLAWERDRAAACRACRREGDTFFSRFGLPVVQLRAYLQAEDYAGARAWAEALDPTEYPVAESDGVPLGRWVTPSVYTYFRITRRELMLPDVRVAHRAFLLGGLLTYRATMRIVAEQRPDHLFAFNARLAPYRIAFEVARQAGIPVLVHERGPVDDSFLVSDHESSASQSFWSDCFSRWRDVPLRPEEVARSKAYLRKREGGAGLGWPAYYDYQSDVREVRHRLQIPDDARVLGVFTSSEFELAGSSDLPTLANQIGMIDALVEAFRARRDFLVVRHHPHIGGSERASAELDFLTRAYKQARGAPANVRFIMPHEKLSSYALFWHLSGAVAFASTVALETEGRGIATASLPGSAFRPATRASIESTDPAALNRLVDELFEATDASDVVAMHRCYATVNALTSRLPWRFKTFGIADHFSADLRIKTADDLFAGHDPALDRICDHVLTGHPLEELPPPPPHALASEAREALETEIGEVLERRRSVRRNARIYSAARLLPEVSVIEVGRPGAALELRSRHRAIRRIACPVGEGADGRETLRAIRRLAAEAPSHYLVVTSDLVFHDESFVSAGLDHLLGDPELACRAVMSGAWIACTEGRLRGQVFTARAPVAELGQGLSLLPEIARPEVLLAFALWRRAALLDAVDEVTDAVTTSDGVTKALFERLGRGDVKRTLAPMLIVQSSSGGPR